LQGNTGGYKKKMGALGEKIAGEYLINTEGYNIVARNYTCPLGELDIVAYEGETLVFVEVRSGSTLSVGYAEESIGFRKQKKLRQLAAYYLKEKGMPDCFCRFDVVIVLFEKGRSSAKEIKLLKNAF
jgi:putative endonuclease